MLKHARNYDRIHRMYNFYRESPPGSDMAKAIQWFKEKLPGWDKKARRYRELERRRMRRLEQRHAAGKGSAAKEVRGPAQVGLDDESRCQKGTVGCVYVHGDGVGELWHQGFSRR
jgi:hypothetical protein